MADGTLRSYRFRKEREASWRRLEALLNRAERSGLKDMPAKDLFDLPILYRASLSSLSVARTISLDINVIGYLQSLNSRAYFFLYGSRDRFRDTLGRFFVQDLPGAVFGARWLMLVAALLMLAGGLTGYGLTRANSDWYYAFFPESLAQGRTPTASTDLLRDTLYPTRGDQAMSDQSLSIFATYLFTHNARIGIMAFALGFALGLPTMVLLFYNGLTLGAFVALFASRGLGPDVAGWLMVHGTTELLAVILCGGAGLMLGRAMVATTQRSRLAELSLQGRRAGVVVLGCVILFLIAGLLEGFVRQTVTDLGLRVMIGSGFLIVWLAYFFFWGARNGHR